MADRKDIENLYNAGVAMNMAKDTPASAVLSQAFVDRFISAPLHVRVTVGYRLAVWRVRSWMQGRGWA